MELVFDVNGEAVTWPDGEPVLREDLERVGVKRREHENCSIKRFVWEGDRIKTIDFGVDLDMF
jgi:hypothetical protein